MSGSSLWADRTPDKPAIKQKLFAFLLAWLLAAAPFPLRAESPPDIVVADFTSGPLKGLLGNGALGIWKLDADDPRQDCRLTFHKDSRRETCLAVDFKLNSPEPNRSKAGFWITLGNLDLTAYNVLQIELRGDPERGYARAIRIELKEPNPRRPSEMIRASWKVEGISSEWKTFDVPLSRMNGITDWRDVREFVMTFVDRLGGAREGRIYVRKITIAQKGGAHPWTGDIYERRRVKNTDQLYGKVRAVEQIKRLKGFPSKTVIQKDFPADDGKFLKMIAKDTWKYFDNIVDRKTGLPLDNITLSQPMALGESTAVGDYTNITNVGLYFAALPAAEDFGFISRSDANARALKALESLKNMESFRGMLYNYYDTTTLEKTTHFLSSVDTGWLLAGLIMIRNSYPGKAAEMATEFINRMDMKFFYDPVEREIYHGYYQNIDSYLEYHYGVFYTEARATSFIGIAKGDIPVEHWFSIARTFPESWSWQTQVPQNRGVMESMGQKFYGGNYSWKNEAVIPSWGGSMFEAMLPSLLIDEVKFSPNALGLNNLRHAKAQVQYAAELGYPVWGLSPASDTEGGYSEFGVKQLGLRGYPDGVVTPHATFLALPYLHEEAIKNLREMILRYPIYGEYGFYDAIKIKTGKVAYRYLALDQAMSFLGLANALNPGKLHARFHSDPIVQKGESVLSAEPPLEK